MVERDTVNILINVRFILKATTIYRTQSMLAILQCKGISSAYGWWEGLNGLFSNLISNFSAYNYKLDSTVYTYYLYIDNYLASRYYNHKID